MRVYLNKKNISPEEKNQSGIQSIEVEEGTTLLKLLQEQGIENVYAFSIMVNGQKKDPDYTLKEGDRIFIFRPLIGG